MSPSLDTNGFDSTRQSLMTYTVSLTGKNPGHTLILKTLNRMSLERDMSRNRCIQMVLTLLGLLISLLTYFFKVYHISSLYFHEAV